MKKAIIVVIYSLALIGLFSWGAYTVGFSKGHDAAYKEARSYYFDEGSEEIICEELDAAARFVREDAEWHPEEAWEIITRWRSGQRKYGNLVLTEEIYEEAIVSLCRFYEYFYDGHFR